MLQNPNPIVKNFLLAATFCFFFSIFIGIVLFFTGCSYIPDLAKDVEDYATDDAIKIEVSREALSENHNIDIDIKVNKTQGK